MLGFRTLHAYNLCLWHRLRLLHKTEYKTTNKLKNVSVQSLAKAPALKDYVVVMYSIWVQWSNTSTRVAALAAEAAVAVEAAEAAVALAETAEAAVVYY